MSKPVRTTPLADLHILELDAWWRENREKAPDLFDQELALAFRTIAAAPAAGRRYPHPTGWSAAFSCARPGTTSTTSSSPTTS
jgi:hypothetical protein